MTLFRGATRYDHGTAMKTSIRQTTVVPLADDIEREIAQVVIMVTVSLGVRIIRWITSVPRIHRHAAKPVRIGSGTSLDFP